MNKRIRHIWTGIKQRCGNPKCNTYPHYGGLGITMCDEWKNSCDAFVEWAMRNGYRDDLSIDRIDNKKGYSPDNCRWATRKEQTINRKATLWITLNGTTKCLSDWSKEKGISKRTVLYRYHHGVTGENLFKKPQTKSKREGRMSNENISSR